jgi:hypothetical protein
MWLLKENNNVRSNVRKYFRQEKEHKWLP